MKLDFGHITFDTLLLLRNRRERGKEGGGEGEGRKEAREERRSEKEWKRRGTCEAKGEEMEVEGGH